MNVQMNARIEEELKAAGDEVFAQMGLALTQVVRSVWRFASEHREEPAIIKAALESSSEGFARIERDRAAREIQDASNLIARFRDRFGIPHSEELEEHDYRAVRERALYERMVERGLA